MTIASVAAFSKALADCSLAASRPVMVTLKPRPVSWPAVARPTPDDPPTMTTCFDDMIDASFDWM
jgi:hypothetical protein